MKQKLYILGVVTLLIIVTGTIFKVNHWPGAGYLLIIGIATLVLVFLPLALINNYKKEGSSQSKLLHMVIWLTCFLIFTSMLFKVQHWPYAGTLLTIAIPFPYLVFLPVFLVTTAKNKNFNIYHTVAVFMLLAVNSVFSALLALNVSRARIIDSYGLANHYNKVEIKLDAAPGKDIQSPVIAGIDEVLNIAKEYKDLILRVEGTSTKAWEDNAGNLQRPDSRQVAIEALSTTGNARIGEKLDNSMKALLKEAENTPGCEDLAKALPAILDLRIQDEDMPSLVWHNITNNLSWTLIYLDGVETNLKLIKATL